MQTPLPSVVRFPALAALPLLLAGCSGGGSTPATAPTLQNLVVTPAALYATATPTNFVAHFDFADPNGDLVSAGLMIRNSAGDIADQQTIPIQQAAGLTAAQLVGGATAVLDAPGVFTVHLTLTDRTGLVSNEVTATVEVKPFPWTTEPRIPVAVRMPAAAVLGDRVYAIGGERTDLSSRGPASGAANAYDPVSRAWTALPPMPTRRLALQLVASGGRLYAIGGATTPVDLPLDTVSNVVEEFDPATQSWRARAPMPTPRAQAAAVELNGRIVVIGGDPLRGYSSSDPIGTVESYDPTTDTWSTLPSLPEPRARMHAVAYQGKIYVGGYTEGLTGRTDRLDVYDPVANSWSVLPYSFGITGIMVTDGTTLWVGADAGMWRTTDPSNTDWHRLTPMQSVQNPGNGPSVRFGRSILAFGEFDTLRYTIDDEIL